MTKRILSGIQPSGKLHLGNYFGAIRQHIALQDEGAECFYFIADYHALTTLKDAEEKEAEEARNSSGKVKPRKAAQILADNVRDVALDYLALGLDPAHVALYRQSDVPEVTELAWMLATVTGMGLLERATSYKDKVERGLPASVGLFTYPILMAADILIVRSHVVPVGKDQVQHLEMTRDMAGYFNKSFGSEVFPLPVERLDKAATVPGTDGKKMSKSYGNTIEIFAEGNALKKTVMGIVSDSTAVDAPKPFEGNNIADLYALFATDEELAKLRSLYQNPTEDAAQREGRPFGYGDAKKMLLEKINACFGPFREKRKELAARPGYVDEVLKAGAAKARAEARKTMELARRAVGMLGAPVG
ncbi:MAG: tryptophan--tRNA ligase [Gemmataceae bacterium]|nr:tryptophan--tRNA ligase [Gemmataceae bacterium]